MKQETIKLLERGYGAQQSGDTEGAERSYRQVLDSDNGNVHALNLLGMLLVNTGRPDEAIEYLQRTLQLHGDDPQTHANIALAYNDLGRTRDAIKHFESSLKMDESNPVVFNNLGNVLRLRDRPRDAIIVYERALKLAPDFAECWSNLSAALNEIDRYERGLQAVDRALQLDSSLAQAWNNKGDLLLSKAQYREALNHYQKAVDIDPRYVSALINMARVQRDMDSPEAGLETLERALALEPQNPTGHHILGVLHEQMGNREDAAESFLKAIAVQPELGVAHYNLAQLKGRGVTDDEFALMKETMSSADMSPKSRMYMAFALSRAYEQRGDSAKAFSCLIDGNSIKAQSRPYDDEETASYLDAIAAETEAVVSRGVCGELRDQRPVFVLGMPRSGTSLTEQILASHSEVAGAGELPYAYDTVHRVKEMTGEKFPDNLRLLNNEQFGELGRYYMGRHKDEDLAVRYVVDKTPLNFQYIGVLALALPEARFIHCHRHPIANCHAIHRMPFDEKQTYAHDLEALGRYYTRYWNLMQKWKALFPGRILDVRYEDTVADIGTQAQRILQFLELPFEEEVLEFHKTRRLVKTPSASQVREPIYKESVAAWKKYEEFLGPLTEHLNVQYDG